MPPTATIKIAADQPGPVISKHIFGHFAEHLGRCIYDGLWVGPESDVPNVRGWRSDLVHALRTIKIPNLRWPGGCYADDYHWRDGIGPRKNRPRRINAHWGGVIDDNSVGTHEFLDLCEQLSCEPYLAGNVGSGSPGELREWVEYVNAVEGSLADERTKNGRSAPWNVRLWGVGNENWGCGGHMRPEYYADQFWRYATYVRSYPNAPAVRIACGPNEDDYNWTEVLMREASVERFGFNALEGLSFHNYTVPGGWKNRQPASPVTTEGWNEVMALGWRMDELVQKHCEIMDNYDPAKHVALVVDEWGSWYKVEEGTNPRFLFQQQTMRDAVLAALTLNVFVDHCDRIRFANLAQVVNVLHSVALTEPDGGRLVLTPTWHVFDLYSVHQEANRLSTEVETVYNTYGERPFPQVSSSASLDKEGRVNILVTNTHPLDAVETSIAIAGREIMQVNARAITTPNLSSCNTFEQPNTIVAEKYPGVSVGGGRLEFTLPSASVMSLVVDVT